MNMLGASVDSETLENALKFNLDNKAFKPAVNVLLSNLRTIYYDLNKGNEKVKDGEYIDLLSTCRGITISTYLLNKVINIILSICSIKLSKQLIIII
jgi:hypothetical protein